MTPTSITPPKAAPVRKVDIWKPDVICSRTPEGVLYVRPRQQLGAYPRNLLERLEHWAATTPDRVFMAQRESSEVTNERGGQWRTLTYAQARTGARDVAQALLDRGLGVERPVAILSGNDLEHLQLGLGAMYAGIPYAPISPAYSLISTDYGKLRYILGLLTPGLVFASPAEPFAKAIEAAVAPGTEIVSELPLATATSAVDRAFAQVGPDTIAKILFTSGSTGMPKGVINTQRMLASNQELVRSVLPFVDQDPPILCDWLPWNHTFAGNHDTGFVLYNGGTYYIDEGRPTSGGPSGGMEATVRNLDDVRPNVFLNVPRGFEALLPFLRSREEFRRRFFSRLKMFYYAGASLSQPVWDELQQLAVETCGERILVFTGLGSTETAPAAMFPGDEIPMAGFVGFPAPGVELKLVPDGEKLELRLRGPGITPGYWRQPELNAAMFDEEGYYRIGDALKLYDRSDPSQGFVFDGRIAEDFKLATGTWVSVGPLRAKFLAHCQPFAQEVVIAGHDRDDVTALIFPHVEACRGLCPELGAHAPVSEVVSSLGVRAKFENLLRDLAAGAGGSSKRIARAILLATPPSIDAHEVTDKGSLNQGAILRHRAALVEELYTQEPSPSVIVI